MPLPYTLLAGLDLPHLRRTLAPHALPLSAAAGVLAGFAVALSIGGADASSQGRADTVDAQAAARADGIASDLAGAAPSAADAQARALHADYAPDPESALRARLEAWLAMERERARSEAPATAPERPASAARPGTPPPRELLLASNALPRREEEPPPTWSSYTESIHRLDLSRTPRTGVQPSFARSGFDTTAPPTSSAPGDMRSGSAMDEESQKPISNEIRTEIVRAPSPPSPRLPTSRFPSDAQEADAQEASTGRNGSAGEGGRSLRDEIVKQASGSEAQHALDDAGPPRESWPWADDGLPKAAARASDELASGPDSTPRNQSPIWNDALDLPLALEPTPPREGERELPDTGVGAPDLPGPPQGTEASPLGALADHGLWVAGETPADLPFGKAEGAGPLAAAPRQTFDAGPPPMAVPEPSTALLVASGLVGLALRRRAARP